MFSFFTFITYDKKKLYKLLQEKKKFHVGVPQIYIINDDFICVTSLSTKNATYTQKINILNCFYNYIL